MTGVQIPPPPPPAAPDAEPVAKGTNPARLLGLAGLLALSGVLGGWAMPVVILGVVLMIFLHELGHYLAARAGGMKVTEFFIGFGPRIWSFHRGETEYGFKAIPAGAYVKIIGMNNLDEVPPEDEARTYRQQSYPKRLLVAVAGSGMHFAQAIVLMFVLLAFVGVPGGSLTEVREWEVGEVVDGSAADAAGLEVGDRVVSLDGRRVESFQPMAEEIAERPGEQVVLGIRRDGELIELPATLGRAPDDSDRGLLGIRPERISATVGVAEAATTSFRSFGDQVGQTLGFLGDLFTPGGVSSYAERVAEGDDDPAPAGSGGGVEPSNDDGRLISIVGAVRIGTQLTEEGLAGFLAFFVGINITIGVLNLLPMLPLDGGHVVVATYERIRSRRGQRYHADVARLLPLAYAVVTILFLIGVTSLYLDLIDPVDL